MIGPEETDMKEEQDEEVLKPDMMEDGGADCHEAEDIADKGMKSGDDCFYGHMEK